jgi:hypothetical protein
MKKVSLFSARKISTGPAGVFELFNQMQRYQIAAVSPLSLCVASGSRAFYRFCLFGSAGVWIKMMKTKALRISILKLGTSHTLSDGIP